jgi:hypothetical protein
MRFQGRLTPRSSVQPNAGPPGETEVLRLNPARKQRILAITEWPRLESGSLNLDVDPEVLEALLGYVPIWTEPGSSVRYPFGFEHIPLKRGEYYYYAANAQAAGKSEEVLVRRPRNIEHYPYRVELFAATNLTVLFGLQVGQQVTVELDPTRSPPK